jgi:catechol 2,3-dioxygenase-like lactoylglutathione lyase family enzyme
MLNHFDHLTLAVEHVDSAVSAYQTLLGSPPTWRGDHPELGTSAALFGLANAMIELVGPRGDAPEAEGMRAWLAAHGEGLQALALATDDAASCSQALRERGLRATPPQDGTAQSLDGDSRSYRTVELSTRSTRGLAVLAVERSDRARLFSSGVSDPAVIEALDHVVIRSADLDAAIALYGTGLGLRLALDRVVRDTRMLFFRIGGVTVEIVHDPSQTSQDVFGGAAYRVRDIAAAHARLRAAGMSVSEPHSGAKPGTQVFSVREGTCGVPTLIVRDPSRD